VEVEKVTKLDYNTYCYVEKFNLKDGDKVIFIGQAVMFRRRAARKNDENGAK
jgi:hypothetical protein